MTPPGLVMPCLAVGEHSGETVHLLCHGRLVNYLMSQYASYKGRSKISCVVNNDDDFSALSIYLK